MIKNKMKILTALVISMSVMLLAPVSNVKVQAKTITQTIKNSKGNEDAKKLSSKLQFIFYSFRAVEYKDNIKDSKGAKKLLIWLEQHLTNNKLEIENYINSNKEFSKDIAAMYKNCLLKRKSIYSTYATKFNIAIPSDISITPSINNVDKAVTSIKPVESKVEKVVALVKPVENKVEKVVAPIKPVENKVKKAVTTIKSVKNKVEKENSKELNLQTKLPKTGSNTGGLALGIIGMISTMFGIVLSKINRK